MQLAEDIKYGRAFRQAAEKNRLAACASRDLDVDLVNTDWTLRLAHKSDIGAIEKLIPLSVRGLQADYYSTAQMEAALGSVFGVDRQLIRDGTYYVVVVGGSSSSETVGDRHRRAPPSIGAAPPP